MARALTMGPYYQPAIRRGETQRRALGMQGYSPEELAGISYGDLQARYEREERRRESERQYKLQKTQTAINLGQMRNQEQAQEQAQWGQAIAGGATLLNVADQLGVWDWLWGDVESGQLGAWTQATGWIESLFSGW